MTLEELEAEAMKLEPAARAVLIRRLSASLASHALGAPAQPPPPPSTPTDEEKERQWLQDALRRSRELRERQVQTEPPDRRPHPPGGAHATEKRPAPKRRDAKPKPKPKSRPKPKPKPRRPAPKKRAASRPKPKPKSASRLGKPRSGKARAKSRPAKRRR